MLKTNTRLSNIAAARSHDAAQGLLRHDVLTAARMEVDGNEEEEEEEWDCVGPVAGRAAGFKPWLERDDLRDLAFEYDFPSIQLAKRPGAWSNVYLLCPLFSVSCRSFSTDLPTRHPPQSFVPSFPSLFDASSLLKIILILTTVTTSTSTTSRLQWQCWCPPQCQSGFLRPVQAVWTAWHARRGHSRHTQLVRRC